MNIKIILLQNVYRLGKLGEVCAVKGGYGRYLIAHKMALRMTQDNLKFFEAQRQDLEKRNRALNKEAEDLQASLEGYVTTFIKQASDSGQLYGSVNAKDIVAALEKENFCVQSRMVTLGSPIKKTGIFDVVLNLRSEIQASIKVVVARTAEEAELFLKKEAEESPEEVLSQDPKPSEAGFAERDMSTAIVEEEEVVEVEVQTTANSTEGAGEPGKGSAENS